MDRRAPRVTLSSIMRKADSAQGLFILQHGTRRVLVTPPLDYDALQESIRGHFPEIPDGSLVSYHTNELPICEGSTVEVSSNAWSTAIPLLKRLTVQVTAPDASSSGTGKGKRRVKEEGNEAATSRDDGSDCEGHQPPTKKQRVNSATSPMIIGDSAPRKTISIVAVGTFAGKDLRFNVSPTVRFSQLRDAIENAIGLPAEDQRLFYNGERLDGEYWSTLREEMEDGGCLYLYPNLKGGKPVVYILPPSGQDVEAIVRLSLVPEWELSGIYPVVPITSSAKGGQALEWVVKASPDGTLLEKKTGLEVSYLFWEAEALKLPSKPLSPLPSPSGMPNEAVFIPTDPRIDATNSVVLKVVDMTPYLDKALKDLGLHTEARTSFITYWLPSFLKHKLVALRFLPQTAYEKAAPLEVSPSPDVTVRIFMLFKGLQQDEVEGAWGVAVDAVREDTVRWRSIVGVDDRSLADDTLFRVVEWGGMEVL